MYNYAVLGKKSKSILSLKQSTAWGENSIISYLSKQNAIGIGINIDIENFGWVAIHCAEEKFKVPYRYYKKFKGINLDNKKKVFEKHKPDKVVNLAAQAGVRYSIENPDEQNSLGNRTVLCYSVPRFAYNIPICYRTVRCLYYTCQCISFLIDRLL